eukprot:GHVH01014384.1.p1 GENE.GHVH01014384.1~~GHVH01014384.1.p1  ORF type:complete len:242 (-),score=20.12 GHVH01014384.1:335-1060(-)
MIQALATLRQAADTLTNATVSRVNHDDVMTIHTDWSKAGVGVVVSIQGKPFLAATIPNSQLMSSLPAPLGELIGIGLAMIKFDFFIKGHKISLHLDAQAAVKAIGNLAQDGKEANYVRYIIITILQYDVLDISHVKGDDNPADCLSRVICPFELDELRQFSCHSAFHEPVLDMLDPVVTEEDEGQVDEFVEVKLHVATHLHDYAHFGLARTRDLRDQICPDISDDLLDVAIARCRMCSFVR